MNIFYLQELLLVGNRTPLLAHLGILGLRWEMRNDIGNALALILDGLKGPAAILRLPATATNPLTGLQDLLPPILLLLLDNREAQVLVQLELAAPNTYTLKNIHDLFVELPEIHGPREPVVTEMPRTAVICLTAGSADLSVVQHSHAGIKEAANLGLIALKGGLGHHFHDGSLLNFVGRHDTELDADHRLYVRGGLIKS